MKLFALLFLVGCAANPTAVELPIQLPSPTSHAQMSTLLQPHTLSIKEHEELIKGINEDWQRISNTFQYMVQSETWNHEWWLIRMLVEKMSTATTLEDFRFYRGLFWKCSDLVDQGMSFVKQTTQQLTIINQQIIDGPPK